MKLEIAGHTSLIKSYEYRDTTDIEEVIIPDSVEIIGEGAFTGCKNLSKFTVGKGVKQINLYAFDHIGKKLDIVWLSKLSYKSPFIKILPSFDDIDGICAPYRNFFNAGEKEKRALVCGFILHPEYKPEYTEELKKEYVAYINHDFSGHFNELCDRAMILKIFLKCLERKFIQNKELMRQFISYIRTCRMTKEEKELIDKIESEEGLLETEEDQRSKKLRRYIREHMVESQMQDILAKENLCQLPAIPYKNSEQKVPDEALKCILVSYISQWTYMDNRPSGFHPDQAADYVADQLQEKALLCVLEKIAKEHDVKHPRRMVPFLRYADDKQLENYVKKSEVWSKYDIYGEEGILAKETFEQAILLNDSETALLYAYRNNRLSEYAFLRKTSVEDLFLKVADILEKNQLSEELKELEKKYIHKLHVDYLSGKRTKKKDWYRWNMTQPVMKNMASTLVWEKAEKHGPYFVMTENGAVDENRVPVILEEDGEICLAHPVFMDTDQIRGFQNILKEKNLKQCFNQLKYIKHKLDLGDWELWNRRYYKMEVPYERLQELTERGFQLDGRMADRLRISYYGKTLMEAFPSEEKHSFMRLGYILGSNYNMREINESVAILDDVFCFEMILAGRMEAAPYLNRFDENEIEELLNASIEQKHNENTAVLLEHKAKMAKNNEDEDLALNW